MAKKQERYFIVCYRCTALGNQTVTGSTNYTVSNGGYLNMEETIKQIIEHGIGFSDVVITNIIELTKNDFQYWTSKNSTP